MSCVFLRGKPREVEEPLFFEPPSRGLPGVEKGALIEIAKGVFGLPDSPRGWWQELRDALQGVSWRSLKVDRAFFCLRDFSGHLIGMSIVHVDDMLLSTNDSHQAESHISRLLHKYDIKDVKRADDDGGVLCCGKRVRTVPDGMKPAGLSLRQDQTEFVIARCEPAILFRVRARQEGAQCTTSEIREMRSMTGSLHWVTGGTRPDESFATSQLQRKQSAPLVSDHKRAVRTFKRLRNQPEIGLRFRPLPSKMCVLVYTDSALLSTCVSIHRQCWFCICSVCRTFAVSAEVFPVFCPSLYFPSLCGHILCRALELMSALFSF